VKYRQYHKHGALEPSVLSEVCPEVSAKQTGALRTRYLRA